MRPSVSSVGFPRVSNTPLISLSFDLETTDAAFAVSYGYILCPTKHSSPPGLRSCLSVSALCSQALCEAPCMENVTVIEQRH